MEKTIVSHNLLLKYFIIAFAILAGFLLFPTLSSPVEARTFPDLVEHNMTISHVSDGTPVTQFANPASPGESLVATIVYDGHNGEEVSSFQTRFWRDRSSDPYPNCSVGGATVIQNGWATFPGSPNINVFKNVFFTAPSTVGPYNAWFHLDANSSAPTCAIEERDSTGTIPRENNNTENEFYWVGSGPTFTVEVLPSTLQVDRGGFDTFTINVTSDGVFSGNVDLTLTTQGALNGAGIVTDPITPTRVFVSSSGAAAVAFLTVRPSSSATLGNHTVTIEGQAVSGPQVATDSATLIVTEDIADPWIETKDGTVGAIGKIDMDRSGLPLGEYNASYLAISGSLSAIKNFTSAKTWLVSNYDIRTGFTAGAEFEELWEKFGDRQAADWGSDGVIPTSGGIYAYPSVAAVDSGAPDPDFEYTGAAVSGSEPVILFINGNMKIEADLNLGSKKVVFIVKKNISMIDTTSGETITFPYTVQSGVKRVRFNPLGSDDSLIIIEGDVFSNDNISGDSDCSPNFCRIYGEALAVTDCNEDGGVIVVPGPCLANQLPVPIPTIDETFWRNAAADPSIGGGTTNCGLIGRPCDIVGQVNREIGPQKFDGDLLIEDSSVIIKGPIHVTGDFRIEGTSTVTLDDSFGSNGTVIIIDGTFRIRDDSRVLGTSASPRGYLLFYSLGTGTESVLVNPGLTHEAIYMAPDAAFKVGTVPRSPNCDSYPPAPSSIFTLTGAWIGKTVELRSCLLIIKDPDLDFGRFLVEPPEPVKTIDGFYVAGGTFSSGNCQSSDTRCQLTVNGAVIAFGGVSLGRGLGISNLINPSEIFNYDPAYLWILRSLLGGSTKAFEELSP